MPDNYVSNLFNLIWFRHGFPRLEIQNFLHSRSPENVVTTVHALEKSQGAK